VTVLVRRGLAARPPGGAAGWRRRNYRDREVDLLAGPAVAAGAAVALLPLAAAGRPGGVLVTAAAGALGAYDDLVGGRHARGLRGHLRALRSGQLTTGAVKLGGLTAAAGGAAALDAGTVGGAPLVAGTANLVNLLDLRPGRALKATLGLCGALLAVHAVRGLRGGHPDAAAGAAALAVAGVAAVALPGDLAERTMIGDCGANALGAAVGAVAVATLSRRGRAAALTAVVALTLASERVSFSAVIERTPVLARMDAWGRRAA
jgi:hypothetical protein